MIKILLIELLPNLVIKDRLRWCKELPPHDTRLDVRMRQDETSGPDSGDAPLATTVQSQLKLATEGARMRRRVEVISPTLICSRLSEGTLSR
jgi:hypothetical protein